MSENITPAYREEKLLANIAGEDYDITPATRKEKLLAEIAETAVGAAAGVEDLRDELSPLLDGGDVGDVYQMGEVGPAWMPLSIDRPLYTFEGVWDFSISNPSSDPITMTANSFERFVFECSGSAAIALSTLYANYDLVFIPAAPLESLVPTNPVSIAAYTVPSRIANNNWHCTVTLLSKSTSTVRPSTNSLTMHFLVAARERLS